MRARILALALATSLLPAAPAQADSPRPPGNLARGNPDSSYNVMAPLKIQGAEAWATFRADLRTVSAYGVDAVSVDVWWGDVEKRDNRFTWGYYDRVFREIKLAGLDIAPILSFHQCGGNVGDDYTSLLPSWLWRKYEKRRVDGVRLGRTGLQHRSEQGNWSAETVSGWGDRVVRQEYVDFTRAFVRRYDRDYGREISELNVSLGPSGELRYPAYNSHDTGSGYPGRGALQSYSPLAQADFRAWTKRTYGSLERVNRAWGTRYRSWQRVASPTDADDFFDSGAYRSSRYGRDFVDWYNGALVAHGKRMLTTVTRAVGDRLRYADIGYKVPGIHWQMAPGSPFPRATEVTTGLIQTSVREQDWATGHGYARIVRLAGRIPTTREVTMHFTALEMDDQVPGADQQYSLAKTLVGWIGDYAARVGTPLKGENALNGGLYDDQGWDNITDAFERWGYEGLTVLRMTDVGSGDDKTLPRTRYARLIDDLRTPAAP